MARRRIIEVDPLDRDSDQHRAMLSREIGQPTFGREMDVDNGGPQGIGLFLRPLGLFVLTVSLFLIVLGVKLWRDGVFDPVFASKGAKAEPGTKRWMLGDRVRVIAPDRPVTAPDFDPETQAPIAKPPPPPVMEEE